MPQVRSPIAGGANKQVPHVRMFEGMGGATKQDPHDLFLFEGEEGVNLHVPQVPPVGLVIGT